VRGKAAQSDRLLQIITLLLPVVRPYDPTSFAPPPILPFLLLLLLPLLLLLLIIIIIIIIVMKNLELLKIIQEIPEQKQDMKETQRTAIFGSEHILRKVLI